MSQILVDKATEIMKRYGPKDEVWACLYEAKDMPYIHRIPLKNKWIDELYLKSESAWNDHHSTILKLGNKNIPIIGISKAEDLPTYPGLIQCCRQIIGTSTTRWRYYAVGSDSREARPYQQQLYTETQPRADMTIPAQGSATRSGSALRFVGIFPVSFPTITVRESGVSTVNTGTSLFLNRNMFSNVPISHIVSVTGFTVACLLTFASVQTWG